MRLPEAFLNSLSGIKGFDKEAFEKVHASGEQITSIRLNPAKPANQFPNPPAGRAGFPIPLSPIPWAKSGYYLPTRPSFTFDPLFHAGCYYVQEASSMFLEQALKQTVDLSRPLKILDLCAAPGGKSTHIQSLISDNSLLVSNEVIRSRANILKDNIVKWGCSNVMVTNNDPKDFSQLENYFDVIVVDAPCSGSGLFRREPDAIGEWSLNNVALCSQRQQRILADILPALKNGGVLVYSTCSYSKEEDEEIVKWMTEEFGVTSLELRVESEWGIVGIRSPDRHYGYRFFPDKVKGEGFFISCLRKTDGAKEEIFKTKNKPDRLSKMETGIVEKWIKKNGLEFIKHLNTVYAWPHDLAACFNFLLAHLHVVYSGTVIGELVRDKLVPAHALAMSGLIHESIARTALNDEQAIAYLKKKDLKMGGADMGWQLVTYKGQNLGWVNVLPNRINNYYPKELRILKES